MGVHDITYLLFSGNVEVVSDDELLAAINEAAQREQQIVDDQLRAGCDLIINKRGGSKCVVHRTTCASVAHYLDRRAEWLPNGWTVELLRREIRHGGFSPRMPQLATEDDLEEIPTYLSCQICKPDLKRQFKKSADSKTSDPNKLGEDRIGRRFVSPETPEPWTLVRIERTITAQGTTTVLYDENGSVPLSPGTRVRLLPKEPALG
ncbi:hypothetical protein ACFQ36_02950 [Arthrobacter sp. GCM10027362]|uniref:hypothetical protein n=1 Tax=Arthrobacter sp. GCM10027362 TaxID=3273379 RepID=UPI0036382BF3